MGVLIGLGLTYVMFSERGCTEWLPANRIKEDITTRGIVASENVDCLLLCNGLTISDVADLVGVGSINYSESKPREIPRIYKIEADGKVSSAMIALTDSSSTILGVTFPTNRNCDCK